MPDTNEILRKLIAARNGYNNLVREKESIEARIRTQEACVEETYDAAVKAMELDVPFVIQDPNDSTKCYIITKVKRPERVEETLTTHHTHFYAGNRQ